MPEHPNEPIRPVEEASTEAYEDDEGYLVFDEPTAVPEEPVAAPVAAAEIVPIPTVLIPVELPIEPLEKPVLVAPVIQEAEPPMPAVLPVIAEPIAPPPAPQAPVVPVMTEPIAPTPPPAAPQAPVPPVIAEPIAPPPPSPPQAPVVPVMTPTVSKPQREKPALRVIEVTEPTIELYEAPPLKPVAPVPAASPEIPAPPEPAPENTEAEITAEIQAQESSLQLLEILPKKPLSRRAARREANRTAIEGGVSLAETIVRRCSAAAIIAIVVIGGASLLFGQGGFPTAFHGAAFENEGVTGRIMRTIGGWFGLEERYQWELTVYDGPGRSETGRRIWRLDPETVLTVDLSASGSCQLPPMELFEEQKDGHQITRAQRQVICLSELIVERSSAKSTTDCTEVSDGNRYEDNDTYTVKNESGQTVATLELRCRILAE